MERDQLVFEVSKQNDIPVAMVLSGSNAQNGASLIADSIAKIIQHKITAEFDYLKDLFTL